MAQYDVGDDSNQANTNDGAPTRSDTFLQPGVYYACDFNISSADIFCTQPSQIVTLWEQSRHSHTSSQQQTAKTDAKSEKLMLIYDVNRSNFPKLR